MQREVLNRSVVCDGHAFPVGTPIELIPVHNRESCQRSGWTHVVNVVEPGEPDDQNKDQSDTDQSDLKDDQDQTVGDAASVGPQTLAASATENTANPNTAQADDGAPLAETELELRVVELLAAASITTKGQAREYLAANKTFRIIEGIGKASDAAIRLVIGAE